MKKIKFKDFNGNSPSYEQMQTEYLEAIYGLLHKINKKLTMKTTIQKVNEARRTSGSGKTKGGKGGANRPSNKNKTR